MAEYRDEENPAYYGGFYVTLKSSEIVAASSAFSRPYCTISEWNTKSDGSGTGYKPGDAVKDVKGDISLYAQWSGGLCFYSIGATTKAIRFDANQTGYILQYQILEYPYTSAKVWYPYNKYSAINEAYKVKAVIDNGPFILEVTPHAFCSCYNMSNVELPLCESIFNNAFDGCSKLSRAVFPECSNIRDSVFSGCTALEIISLPKLASVPNGLFSSCPIMDLVIGVQAIDSNWASSWVSSGAKPASITTLSYIKLPYCTNIGSNAFERCYSLNSVDASLCQTVSVAAFRQCSSLSQVKLPAVVTIGGYAFASCSSLDKIDLPACTNIGTGAFQYCSQLSLFSASIIDCIHEGVFRGTPLQQLYLSKCSEIQVANFGGASSTLYELEVGYTSYYSYYSCTSATNYYWPKTLTNVHLPLCTAIQPQAFVNQSKSLTTVYVPKCQIIYANAFLTCSKLKKISLPECTEIYGFAFQSCYSLMDIYLGGSTLVSLKNSNAFLFTPFVDSSYTGSFGSVHVRSSLVQTYKTNTNWAYYSDRIVGDYN